MVHGGTGVIKQDIPEKLEEVLGVKIVDKPVGESEMTPEMEALLREFGLLEDEGSESTDDTEDTQT